MVQSTWIRETAIRPAQPLGRIGGQQTEVIAMSNDQPSPSGETSSSDGGELALWKSVRDGNEDGLRRVVQTYKGRLVGYLRRFLPAPDADDVAQEVWMTVWSKRSEICPSRNPVAWMHTIARNNAISLLRRRREKAASDSNQPSDDDLFSLGSSEQAVSPWPLGIEGVDLRNAFEKAIDQLDKTHRDVVLLRFRSRLADPNMSDGMIKDILGYPYQGTVNQKWNEALEQIRKFFTANQ